MTSQDKDCLKTDFRRDSQFPDFNGQELKTSDVYKTENLPYRFEYPSRWNYGNCVFTPSEGVIQKYTFGATDSKRISLTSKACHPFFRTTNSDYGSKPPCIHTMPHTYHPRNHKYWEHLAKVGMYRNCGFNTGIDKDSV